MKHATMLGREGGVGGIIEMKEYTSCTITDGVDVEYEGSEDITNITNIEVANQK